MEDSADPPALLHEFIELNYRFLRLIDAILDSPRPQQRLRLRASIQPRIHSPGQHHYFHIPIEDLLDIVRLDARLVGRARLIPIPGLCAAGPHFAIFEFISPAAHGHFQATPGDMCNSSYWIIRHLG